jgi:hypothetical protein
VEYYQFNGGFTTNSAASTFTLASTPAAGTQVVAPGITQVIVSAFDQPVVPGVATPLVGQTDCWLCDPSTINNYKYEPFPYYHGIQISVVDLISGGGISTSWIQMASADANGNALTFGATGAPLYLPPLDAQTTLSTTVCAAASTITVANIAQNWFPAQYILINPGGITQEIRQVTLVNTVSSQLSIQNTGFSFGHAAGELIFACGYPFVIQMTVPVNAANNTPVNLYNLGLQRFCAVSARS